MALHSYRNETLLLWFCYKILHYSVYIILQCLQIFLFEHCYFPIQNLNNPVCKRFCGIELQMGNKFSTGKERTNVYEVKRQKLLDINIGAVF